MLLTWSLWRHLLLDAAFLPHGLVEELHGRLPAAPRLGPLQLVAAPVRASGLLQLDALPV